MNTIHSTNAIINSKNHRLYCNLLFKHVYFKEPVAKQFYHKYHTTVV